MDLGKCTTPVEMFTKEFGEMANAMARSFETVISFLLIHFSLTCSFCVLSQGSVYYSNGDVFEGQFVNGHIEGHGKLQCVNGVEYIGEWKHSHVSHCNYL